MNAVQFHLNSTQYGYLKRPIKFAQGQNGVVELRIPLPSSFTAASSVEKEPYVLYNIINIRSNVGKIVAELKSGTSIDLALVGRALTIQADFYNSNMELQSNNIMAEFRFDGIVHQENYYPFLLAGNRDDKYATSLYLSTTGIKTIQTIFFDQRDKSIKFDHTISFTVVDTTHDIEALSQVPVPAPIKTRSMSELVSTKPPTITPVPSIIPPAINFSDNSFEIHGFNTPSTPPLLILEERRRRVEIRYHVTIAIASAVALVLALSLCLLHRRYKAKRVHDVNHQVGDLVQDKIYKNPI